MDGEQTWPTDEELAQAEHKGEGIESNNGFQTFICLSLFILHILYLHLSFTSFILLQSKEVNEKNAFPSLSDLFILVYLFFKPICNCKTSLIYSKDS